MKHPRTAARGEARRRPLVVLAVAAGLAAAGCANNPTTAPSAPSTTPSPPVLSSTPPAEPQAATVTWVKSLCQALRPALSQLGVLPQTDLADPAAARQAYLTYLGKARDVTQQAIDRLPSIGPPPVENGQQILDQIREHLTRLRDNLDDAVTQLNQANPDNSAAIGQAFSAVGNVVGLFGSLASDPQLRAAVDQEPECQGVSGANQTSSANQPSEPVQPTR